MNTTVVAEKGFDKTLPVASYISMLLGFWPIALAVALIDDKREDWIKTHYKYMLKGMLAGLVYLSISTVLSFVLIGFLTMFLTAVWWTVRCVKGMVYLSRNEAMPKPNTWLW